MCAHRSDVRLQLRLKIRKSVEQITCGERARRRTTRRRRFVAAWGEQQI